MLIKHINKRFKVPIRILCKRFDMPKSSIYYKNKKDDITLSMNIKDIALKNPQWGYRMINAQLKRQGISINHKKLYRIYKTLGLQKPSITSNKRHKRITTKFNPAQAHFPNHVWAADFIHDSPPPMSITTSADTRDIVWSYIFEEVVI